MGYSRKRLKQGEGGGQVEDIEFSAIIACQVPASYQPVATNKPLLALFSLFTNATTQLAQLQIAIVFSDIYLFIYYLFTYLSIYLCIYSFIYLLFIYLFIYLFTSCHDLVILFGYYLNKLPYYEIF